MSPNICEEGLPEEVKAAADWVSGLHEEMATLRIAAERLSSKAGDFRRTGNDYMSGWLNAMARDVMASSDMIGTIMNKKLDVDIAESRAAVGSALNAALLLCPGAHQEDIDAVKAARDAFLSTQIGIAPPAKEV